MSYRGYSTAVGDTGRGSILVAMVWMLGLTFALSLLFGWVPIVGPLVGPLVGGCVGGKHAGSPGRAALAAILPTALFALGFAGLAGLLSLPVLGPLAPLLGATVGVFAGLVLFAASAAMFVAALIGGAMR